jgi:hypothetical protein
MEAMTEYWGIFKHASTLVHQPLANGRREARSQLKADAQKKIERNVPLRLQACCNDRNVEKPVDDLKPLHLM